MGAGGTERIINALCSAPHMKIKAYLSALPSLIRKDFNEEIYKIYVTDALQAISKNVEPVGRCGYIEKRYWDVIHTKPEDTRTAEEIIEHMKKKLAQV